MQGDRGCRGRGRGWREGGAYVDGSCGRRRLHWVFPSSSLQHHVWSIDPDEGLGLTDSSICTYSFMGNWRDIGEFAARQAAHCYLGGTLITGHVASMLTGADVCVAWVGTVRGCPPCGRVLWVGTLHVGVYVLWAGPCCVEGHMYHVQHHCTALVEDMSALSSVSSHCR